MQHLLVDLAVSADTIAAAYRGDVRWLQARARDGRSVRLPILWLRRFVSHDGVCGTFSLRLGDGNRLLELVRVNG
jgi:hypothetical protein